MSANVAAKPLRVVEERSELVVVLYVPLYHDLLLLCYVALEVLPVIVLHRISEPSGFVSSVVLRSGSCLN